MRKTVSVLPYIERKQKQQEKEVKRIQEQQKREDKKKELEDENYQKRQEDIRYLVAFRNKVTNRVSLICRIISIGILTAIYSVFKASDQTAGFYMSQHMGMVVTTCLICSIALLVDYFHYVVSFQSTNNALNHPELVYDTGSKTYKIAYLFFVLKQLFTLVGALFYCYLVVAYFEAASQSVNAEVFITQPLENLCLLGE